MSKIIMFFMFVVAFSFGMKLVTPYLRRFIAFMLNEKYENSSNLLEKPRLLFNLIGFLFMVIAMLSMNNYSDLQNKNGEDKIYLFLSIFYFCFGVIIILFTWSTKFKDRYEVKDSSTDKEKQIKIREDIDSAYYVEKVKGTETNQRLIDDNSIEDFKLLLSGKPVESNIKWIKVTDKSKRTHVVPLFDLLNEIIDGGIEILYDDYRRGLISFICDNFIQGNDEKFKHKNLNSRYSEWMKEIQYKRK